MIDIMVNTINTCDEHSISAPTSRNIHRCLEKEEILGTLITSNNPRDVYAYCKKIFNSESDEKNKIYTPNPEIIMKAEEDSFYRDVLNRGTLVVPDGIGVVLASRMKNGKIKNRITGIGLLDVLLSEAEKNGKSVYLLGSKEGVAEAAAIKMMEKYPDLILSGTHHGYFTPEVERQLIPKIAATKPSLLVVALGAPKQEIFIDRYIEQIGADVAIGVGGALDVWAGNVKRAPKLISKIGMEWLYRAVSQPSRIPRLAAIPKFMVRAMLEKRV